MIKVNDESRDDLLPPKSNSQFLRADFLPEKFFSRSHVTAEFFGALEFFFGDALTRDDLFDRHGGIVKRKLRVFSEFLLLYPATGET